ncbi:MerC domain-containing protein [Gammaproteobacteria bacterium]|nr:MerC domain-containing protein [Gammaproteobacteria bacterium]MDA9842688.1 MerC domain-containing protein [Gammaproteobacteria bacterium]
MKTQILSDKFAMTLSMVCLVHCLFAPSLIILSYSFMAMSVDSELVHKLILLITVPVSLFALSLGYKNHSTMNFIVLGIIGLLTLVLAVILGEGVLGENGELFLTMLGSTLVIISHYKNYQICKKTNCDCHE